MRRLLCQRLIYCTDNNRIVTARIPLELTGELCLADEAKPGDPNVLKPGDMVRVDKGTTATWSSPTQGKGKFFLQSTSVPTVPAF